MQGTNKEMMEVLRSQTGGVKATQKLEQQEADTSQEAGVTRGVSRGQSLSHLTGAIGELNTEQEAVQQEIESQRRRKHCRDSVHNKEGSSHSSPIHEEWAAE